MNTFHLEPEARYFIYLVVDYRDVYLLITKH